MHLKKFKSGYLGSQLYLTRFWQGFWVARKSEKKNEKLPSKMDVTFKVRDILKMFLECSLSKNVYYMVKSVIIQENIFVPDDF